MRLFLGISLATLALAQPAKVRQATDVFRNPEGEVVGKLALGDDAVVRSRTTTESGSWCRISGSVTGTVPCKVLLISQPVAAAPPPAPPAAARSGARAASAPAAASNRVTASPVTPDLDLPPIEHPTMNQIRRAFPGHGDPRLTQDATPQTSVIQEYKFPGDNEVSVSLWVRPAGTLPLTPEAELMKKLTAQPASRVRPHLLPGGRRIKWSYYRGDFLVTGVSPDGQYDWTLVYSSPENPDDITSHVLAGSAAVDRLLFGRVTASR